uniref:Lipocalin n=1 Tax=Rhipicephalus appendiculatus TaxID=34631 RepID=A0A131YRF6_RHIAP
MRLRNPFSVFLLVHYVTIAECKLPSVKKTYNIRKFLWTNNHIWTFLTTGATQCVCQADVTHSIDEKEITYYHYFLSHGGTKKHTKMHGIFLGKNIMRVQPHGPPNPITHELLYSDMYSKCAVFKVSSVVSPGGTMNMLNLRVWNTSNIATAAQPCIPQFRKRSTKGHLVYKNFCQEELAKGRPSQDQDMEGRSNPHDLVCRKYG